MMGAPSSSNFCFSFGCFDKMSPKSYRGNRLMFSSLILIFIFSVVVVDAAPRSKSKSRDGPQMVYDQKQTGDYNIQLHLKDFQIIALLGDDSLGDYDYNYDYADFTIKPSNPSTTSTSPKPASPTPPSSTTPKIPSSPSANPQVIGTNPNKPTENPTVIVHTSSPSNPTDYGINVTPLDLLALEPSKKPDDAEKIEIQKDDSPKNTSDATVPPETSQNELVASSSSSPGLKMVTELSASSLAPKLSTSTPDMMTQGKIKVQILDAPSPTVEIASAPVGIIPSEDVNGEVNGGILQGELASYRRCATGFARDKRGRCRRVRKPGMGSQIPFGFGRIASNLATRLRLPTHGDTEEGSGSAEK